MNLSSVRMAMVALLIVSLAGIGICDLLARDWKTAALGLLFATANILIFVVR